MMIGMVVAGIGCLLAGLLAVGLGIPVNEFSFGNTLIVAGTLTACTGLIILSLWVVARELKNIAERLGPGPTRDWKGTALRAGTARSTADAMPGADQADGEQMAIADAGGAPSPTPWLEAAARDRPRQESSSPPVSEPPAKPRRNLMFSSTSRRERERARLRAADPSAIEPDPAAAGPAEETEQVQPANFDDAWPKSERTRSADPLPQRRAGGSASTFSETPAARQPPTEDQPPVTVLKSGVVDGMAYSLYSDGSIEAQMPEGMMRFGSIDELRAHLDHRP